MQLQEVKIEKIKPYENNPRHNEGAVEAVKESIIQCGYIAPIIVDEENVVLAGHTRLRAVIELGMDKVHVGIAEGLTEDQKKKYRLLDNKVNELAQWDYDKLRQESEGLDFGFDFGIDSILEKGDNIKEAKEKAAKKDPVTKICVCPRCGSQWQE